MSETVTLVDINKKKGFPRTYKFNQFYRWFTIILALLAGFYMIYYITVSGKITRDASALTKYTPLVILFLLINSLMRNFFTLNKIIFEETKVKFTYLLKKSVIINYKDITKMEFPLAKRKVIRIHFTEDGVNKIYEFAIGFPNLVEILNSIAEMNDNIELDEFMQKVIVSQAEKNRFREAKFDSESIKN